MTPCTVELFGVARMIAKRPEVPLQLPADATVLDLYGALATAVPALIGRVISGDRAGLVAGYACNVNGLEFVRVATAPIHRGDRIMLLSADAGG